MIVLAFLFGMPSATTYAVAPGRETVSEASGKESKEYTVKAAFLYHFVSYTSWPARAFGKKSDPIELVVLGKNPFGKTLDGVFNGKELHSRKIRIHYLKSIPSEMKAHLIFATGLDQKDLDALTKKYRGKNVMLVGDEAGFAERGSCANFFIKDAKVRFQVNPDEVKRNGLEISSQLLKLASIVKTKERKK